MGLVSSAVNATMVGQNRASVDNARVKKPRYRGKAKVHQFIGAV